MSSLPPPSAPSSHLREDPPSTTQFPKPDTCCLPPAHPPVLPKSPPKPLESNTPIPPNPGCRHCPSELQPSPLSPISLLCLPHTRACTHTHIPHELSKESFQNSNSTGQPHCPPQPGLRGCGDFPAHLTEMGTEQFKTWAPHQQIWICILGGPPGDCVILDESHHLPEPFPHLGNKAAMTFTKKTS